MKNAYYTLPNGSVYRAIYQDNGWLFKDANKSFGSITVCLVPFNGLLYFGEFFSHNREWITALQATEWKVKDLRRCKVEKVNVELSKNETSMLV